MKYQVTKTIKETYIVDAESEETATEMKVSESLKEIETTTNVEAKTPSYSVEDLLGNLDKYIESKTEEINKISNERNKAMEEAKKERSKKFEAIKTIINEQLIPRAKKIDTYYHAVYSKNFILSRGYDSDIWRLSYFENYSKENWYLKTCYKEVYLNHDYDVTSSVCNKLIDNWENIELELTNNLVEQLKEQFERKEKEAIDSKNHYKNLK